MNRFPQEKSAMTMTEMSKRSESISPSSTTAKQTVDPDNDRFPYCLVWTTLPGISAIIPLIGHVGIADSQGIINDFAGPYTISIDNFSFGRPTKFCRLDASECSAEDWDTACVRANNCFCRTTHNIFINNCHHHVCEALNHMSYQKTRWNQFRLFWLLTTQSEYIGWSGWFRTWGPFVIFWLLICGAWLIVRTSAVS